jgi:hypothetical protein
METNPLTVFDPNDLADVRAKALAEQEAQLMTFARTAEAPIERYVQAEIAEEMRNLRIRWALKGLIKLNAEAATSGKAAA